MSSTYRNNLYNTKHANTIGNIRFLCFITQIDATQKWCITITCRYIANNSYLHNCTKPTTFYTANGSCKCIFSDDKHYSEPTCCYLSHLQVASLAQTAANGSQRERLAGGDRYTWTECHSSSSRVWCRSTSIHTVTHRSK